MFIRTTKNAFCGHPLLLDIFNWVYDSVVWFYFMFQ